MAKVMTGVSIEQEMMEELSRIAKETERSRAAVIRIAIKEYLERRKESTP